ncbi:MAG: AmmeMemoRadiSam system radical SAM enzyme [Clostridiales bacterium]|nr:AmmeMemoRadiSam system radical SAM enzyme [Clostridiales bacterium]
MREAEFYEKLASGSVRCRLCPHNCHIASGQSGLCGARRNSGGILTAHSHGAVASISLDPIEKKPLYRFFPGSHILSLGSYGCNFCCPFCQNHRISREKAPSVLTTLLAPEDIAAAAQNLIKRGNIGAAYTYNEPLCGYEYVTDCARLIKAQDQKNVLVTNGYINPEPLARLLPLIDAMNIDLKAFTPEFYHSIGGDLQAVRRTIATAAAHCHVEITTLIIPGKNDAEAEMRELCQWLAGISYDIPLHISRFFPAYQWQDIPPTPLQTIYRLTDIAREYLQYVYTGNC